MSKGGSQHQLEAKNAESSALKLAARSAVFADPGDSAASSFVAHGDWG